MLDGVVSIVYSRLPSRRLGLLLLTSAACAQVNPRVGKEVDYVTRAVVPGELAELVKPEGPERGLWSLAWRWQFHTPQPAAPYREALIQALGPAYNCQQQRRHVRCSRALRGDAVALDVAAHPVAGQTLVKAELKMTSY